ncbi:MAG: L-histidine N(alpha)-methyltransferase [Pseudomonadota bacterium]|nr:L-histidine N(alpha)-methyltransferase [Pseudomonadota bacterium]
MTSLLSSFTDLNPPKDDFLGAVEQGLSRKQKILPCEFFYDERGSQLFDQICMLDEYYPMRTERGILEARLGEIVELIGRNAHLVELGSGASIKTRILMKALPDLAQYTAVDISRKFLLDSAATLAADYPHIAVAAVCADYTKNFPLPIPKRKRASRNVAFFPGSTIGNLSPAKARSFLKKLSKTIERGGGLLIGVDLRKAPSILRAAYNDSAGTTAAFNLNLLERINRELSANFDLNFFKHNAVYVEKMRRIEMRLISTRPQTVVIGDKSFDFAVNEYIHTENSYKYSISDFRRLCQNAGYEPIASWTDINSLFSVHYFTAQ